MKQPDSCQKKLDYSWLKKKWCIQVASVPIRVGILAQPQKRQIFKQKESLADCWLMLVVSFFFCREF